MLWFMRNRLLIVGLIAVLVACPSPVKSTPQPLTLTGTIEGWTVGKSGKLRLKWNQLLSGAINASGDVTTEPVLNSSNGSFTRTLPTSSLENYLRSSSSDLSSCTATVTPENLKTIIFYETLESTTNVSAGIVQESDIAPTGNTTSPAVGSKSIFYIYADQNGSISANCKNNQYTYDVTLQIGWNPVTYSVTEVSGNKRYAFTTGKPSNTKWYLQGNMAAL